MAAHRRGTIVAPLVIAAVGFAVTVSACRSTVPKHAETSSHRDSAPLLTDAAGDGTPDFLRLDTEQDRRSFRRWFTFLAEVQYFTPPKQRAPEIIDCAALLRYCYRQALSAHDGAWAAESRLPLIPAAGSISKYRYPFTPLKANLFRLEAGPLVATDLQNGRFAQFANAETLQRFNTFLVGRDIRQAQPGDLLFFRRPAQPPIFHSMIFIGKSQIAPSPETYIVYNTGPEGAAAGEMRRLSENDLLHFPDPQWRPDAANPQFLGIFRWNILRAIR